jgi:two-component system OmpR family response regulator
MSALLQPFAARVTQHMSATPKPPAILVVDDDPKLREVVGYALSREGYEVHEARHGGDALVLLGQRSFDLLVVDVSMPEVDGFELVRRLRTGDNQTPVLFVSARSDEIDRILGLELGGDDYVTKPFSTRELVTRVKVILRRLTRGRGEPGEDEREDTQLTCGALRLNPTTHRSWWVDSEVVLTATEFRLLEVLMARPGRVYSRDELCEHAYPDTRHVSGRTLDSHVRRIRAKFRDQGVDPIETVHGVGYRLRQP